MKKSKKKIHLGIGHYGIGFQDGVNTVISRNVRALRDIDPDLRITLYGKLSPDYQDFLEPIPGSLEYRDIEEFSAESEFRRLLKKDISSQRVHDYVWQGTNIAEVLDKKLADMDVIFAENLGIGIDPAITFAFYLYTQYCHESRLPKTFIYRVHDFVQQRPHFFYNVKKFREFRFGNIPNWHSVIYPSSPNIKYIAINRFDQSRLIDHGIEEQNIFYIPNSVDQSIVPPDDRSSELRSKIIEREGLDPDVRFILYPVRCIRRKNVEEAIFYTCLLNNLAKGNTTRNLRPVEGNFHLLVSLKPENGDDARYSDQLLEFIRKHKLPVSIGFNSLIALEREMDSDNPQEIRKYAVGDMYRVADAVITTSFLEGFGFTYLEPWILDRTVIGRSIPFVVPDFQAAGMRLADLYNVLIIDGTDFKDIGRELVSPESALEQRLSKILNLESRSFVDHVIERNETPIRATLRVLDKKKRKGLIDHNKKVVEQVYSQSVIGHQLYHLISTII